MKTNYDYDVKSYNVHCFKKTFHVEHVSVQSPMVSFQIDPVQHLDPLRKYHIRYDKLSYK